MSQLRSNPSELDDDDDDDFDDFPDIQVSYRRPTLIACDDKCHNQDELSDYVLVRLAIARAKAMDRYREINTEEKG